MQLRDKQFIEKYETPAERGIVGTKIANTLIKNARRSTLAFRNPLMRQYGTRKLNINNQSIKGGRKKTIRRS